MTGAPNVTITAAAPSPRATELTQAIEIVEPLITAIGEDLLGEPMSPIRWVICENFTAEVGAHLDPAGEATYSGDRVGGVVAAKTMDDPAHGGRAVYLNGPLLCDVEESHSLASLLFLVAHEATHVLQYDTHRIAGVQRDRTGGIVRQAARHLGLYAVDEYRADSVAFLMLGQIASVIDNTTGDSRPAGPQDTFALDHLSGFETAVLDMYPRLADTVEDYRNHRISLDALLDIVVPYTDQLVTLAGHWQAVCDHLDVEDPWALGDLPTAAGTELYARPLWRPLDQFLDSRRLLPEPGDIAEHDRELMAVGEATVIEFWEKLGLTVEDMASGAEYIHVNDPARVA